jgi:hypothetical protein
VLGDVTQYGLEIDCHAEHAGLDFDVARHACQEANTALRRVSGRRSLIARCYLAKVCNDVALAAEAGKSLQEGSHRLRIIGKPGDPYDPEGVLAPPITGTVLRQRIGCRFM